jgi:sugar lactone lactonase YvrE
VYPIFRISVIGLMLQPGAPAAESVFSQIFNPLPLGGVAADYVPAHGVQIEASSLATDRSGILYILDGNGRLHKVAADGTLVPIAGFGSSVPKPGEGINSLLANTGFLSPIAVDPSGNVYIGGGRPFANTVYRITPDRFMEVYATSPDWSVTGVSTDAAGNVYAANSRGPLVRIAPDRAVTTVARIPGSDVAAAGDGTLYVTDPFTSRVTRVDPDGAMTSLPQPAVARGIAVDRGGTLYFTNSAGTVQRLEADGTITTVAGNGRPGYTGDGGPATETGLSGPLSLALDPDGNLYIADAGPVLKVNPAGIISTVVGCSCGGDGVPAPWAKVIAPVGIAADPAGNVYFSDYSTHMVRRIASDGTITTVAGVGAPGFAGDGGPARQARLYLPTGVALDAVGNLYIADEGNNRIRRVSPDGIIQTVAGNGVAGFGGDGGAATDAWLAAPDGVAADAAGNLYIADTVTHRIRKVTPDGIIRTIAGSDQPGLAGDGGPAAQALLFNPRMLAIDAAGNLLFTDTAAHVVRRITPSGIIERVAGTGQPGSSGDGGPATAAQIVAPWGIAADASGNVYIGEMRSGSIRMVDASGTVRSVFGAYGLPNGLAVDLSGRIWMATGFGFTYGFFDSGTVGVLSQNQPPFPLPPLIVDTGVRKSGFFPGMDGSVAPNEAVTITGVRLGPSPAVQSSPGQTAMGGVRVLFDATPARLLYVSSDRIDAIVPAEVGVKAFFDQVTVTVEYNGLTSNPVRLDVLPFIP